MRDFYSFKKRFENDMYFVYVDHKELLSLSMFENHEIDVEITNMFERDDSDFVIVILKVARKWQVLINEHIMLLRHALICDYPLYEEFRLNYWYPLSLVLEKEKDSGKYIW